jgi:electron transfer flavoprotein beta subunit
VAMGCDDAILLTAREFAGADTWATAYTLAQAIRKLGSYDLILCGKQAIDGDTGQVGPGIAKQLGIPQLTYVFRVRAIDFAGGSIEVERLLEEGREITRAPLPALITVVKDINQPRYPTFQGIRRARKMSIPMWTPVELGNVEPRYLGLDGSPTKVIRVFSPPKREGKLLMITGTSAAEMAATLVDKIMQEKIV